MGKVLGVNADGDLQVIFSSSQISKAWFFASAPINRWAKFKPFRYNGDFNGHFTDTSGTPDTSSDRYIAAAAANFGLTVPNTPFASIAAALADSTAWAYNRCRVGTDPCRAMDFEAYFHAASQPVAPLDDPIEIDLSQGAYYDVGAHIIYNISGTDTITWQDLSALSNYYLCVAVGKNAQMTGTLLWKTSSQTLGAGGIRLSLSEGDLSAINSGGYTHIYLCACNTIRTSFLDSEPSAGFLPLPADSQSDLLSEITIYTARLKNISISKVCNLQSPTSASQFVDASDYSGLYPSIGDPDYYAIPLRSGGYYLHFAVNVETTASASFTFTADSFAFSKTFAGNGPGKSRAIVATLRDPNFNAVNSYTIPANSSATLYFTFAYPVLSFDSAGRQMSGLTTGQQISTNITLVQGGSIIVLDELRVSN